MGGNKITQNELVNLKIDRLRTAERIPNTIDGRVLMAVINMDNKHLRGVNIDTETGAIYRCNLTEEGTINTGRMITVNQRHGDRSYINVYGFDMAMFYHKVVSIAVGMYDEIEFKCLADNVVNHKNLNPLDCRPCNLETVTSRENTLHSVVYQRLNALGIWVAGTSLSAEGILGWYTKDDLGLVIEVSNKLSTQTQKYCYRGEIEGDRLIRGMTINRCCKYMCSKLV